MSEVLEKSDVCEDANKVPIKLTHGIGTEFVGKKDGVSRKVGVYKTQKDQIVIEFITYWDGLDKEPTKTILTVGVEAFEALITLMLDFQFNRENWKIDEPILSEVV